MLPKILAEAIGTFILVLTIGLASLQDGSTAPLAIGMGLMVAVYAGGHLSGAHYNPAVTVAAWMRGLLPTREVAPYMGAQFAGAFVAAFLTYKVFGLALHVAPAEGVSLLKAITLEATWTFVLVWVILNVATAKATAGNSHFGLAIGGTVLAGAYAMGGVSGGAFNPAVGVAPAMLEALLGLAPAQPVWIYVVGPVAGAALGAITFKAAHPEG